MCYFFLWFHLGITGCLPSCLLSVWSLRLLFITTVREEAGSGASIGFPALCYERDVHGLVSELSFCAKVARRNYLVSKV